MLSHPSLFLCWCRAYVHFFRASRFDFTFLTTCLFTCRSHFDRKMEQPFFCISFQYSNRGTSQWDGVGCSQGEEGDGLEVLVVGGEGWTIAVFCVSKLMESTISCSCLSGHVSPRASRNVCVCVCVCSLQQVVPGSPCCRKLIHCQTDELGNIKLRSFLRTRGWDRLHASVSGCCLSRFSCLFIIHSVTRSVALCSHCERKVSAVQWLE